MHSFPAVHIDQSTHMYPEFAEAVELFHRCALRYIAILGGCTEQPGQGASGKATDSTAAAPGDGRTGGHGHSAQLRTSCNKAGSDNIGRYKGQLSCASTMRNSGCASKAAAEFFDAETAQGSRPHRAPLGLRAASGTFRQRGLLVVDTANASAWSSF